jgi:cytosine/creatinine deaminase
MVIVHASLRQGIYSGAMSEHPEIILRNGRLLDGTNVDIHLSQGRITHLIPRTTSNAQLQTVVAAIEHDLHGWLVLPAPAEPHAHLDKALTAEQVPNPEGDLLGAIRGWVAASAAGMFTHDDIRSRAQKAMELLVLNGVTAVRSHVNVVGDISTRYLRAVKEARAEMRDLLHVELVALTGSPMTGPDGLANREALDQALQEGVDIIGGCPHLDPDGATVIADVLRLASEYSLPVDLHMDETLDPHMLHLPELARQVIDSGFAGQVTASHCVSLGMQSPKVQAEVATLVAEAGITVVPLPQTNLFLQGREHPQATPRGLTALRPLIDAGVRVAAGADNVQDPFNLVGRSDPLETASLLVMAGHILPEVAYEMVSNNVRAMMGLEQVTLAAGSPADLLVVNAPSVRGAIADAPGDRMVFRAGRLVASSRHQRDLYRVAAN